MTNKRWTTTEEKELLSMFQNNKTYDVIGKKLDRSSSAIKLRLENIVYNNIAKGKNVNELARKMNTTPENIAQMYYTHRSFKLSKGEQVVDINLLAQTKKSNNKLTDQVNIDRIEQENKILDIIIKNCELKQKIMHLHNKNNLDPNLLKLIKQYKIKTNAVD